MKTEAGPFLKSSVAAYLGGHERDYLGDSVRE